VTEININASEKQKPTLAFHEPLTEVSMLPDFVRI
jgi:hypothetical protein